MDIKAQNSFAFSKETMKEEVWDKVNHSVRTYANKRRKGENLDDLYQ
jgi:hypothetical protein